jgi:hypothetical protein
MDPSDAKILDTPASPLRNGTISFTYKVPEKPKGGLYKAIIQENHMVHEAAVIFRVREYSKKLLTITVDMSKTSYFPGETVTVKVKASKKDGSALQPNSFFSYSFNHKTMESGLKFNDQGEATMSFHISKNFHKQAAPLIVTVKDGNTQNDPQETYATTVYITKKGRGVVNFFPESGPTLIADTKTEVYFEAFIDRQETENMEFTGGELCSGISNFSGSEKKVLLENISSAHKGKGKFSFIPEENERYYLEVKGEKFFLPEVQKHGIGLSMSKTIYKHGEDIVGIVTQNEMGDFAVNVQWKDQILEKHIFSVDEEQFGQSFSHSFRNVTMINGGVLQMTVQKINSVTNVLTTRAERLFFMKPRKNLNIEIKMNQESYSPGEKVKFDLEVRDSMTNELIDEPGVVSVVITDLSSYLEINKKYTPASIPFQVYLGNEVSKTNFEMAHAKDYLDALYNSEENYSEDALDLLLGV